MPSARRLRTPRRPATTAPPAPSPSRAVVLYARVSSKEQERDGFSIPAQERLLRDYAERNGMRIVQEFTDIETAKKSGRTNFTKMLAWLKRNKASCRTVLVEKTDRLYRNIKDWVVLDGTDLEIHLVKEGVVISDDARSSDKFMHGIRVLMAKNYIDNLSEECAKGLREKALQGVWPSAAPVGYLNTRDDAGRKIIVPDPERAAAITKLFAWAASEAYSVQVLAKKASEIGLVTRRGGKPLAKSIVHSLLRNPIYMGEFVWGGKTYRGTHEPIIDRDTYERVQAVIDGRYRGTRDNIRADLFSFVGLIKCGHCGCALSAQIQKEKYIYYHCTGAKGRCDMPYVREEVIDKQFAAALATLRIPDELREKLTTGLRASHAQIVAHHADAVQRLEAECARLQRRLDAMYVDKLEGVISEDAYRRHAQSWNEEIATHRKAIIRHDEAKRTYIEEAIELVDLAQTLSGLYPDQPPALKKEMLREVVSNSYWWAGELTVEFRKPFDFLREINEARKYEPPVGPGSDGGSFCMVAGAGFEPTTFGL